MTKIVFIKLINESCFENGADPKFGRQIDACDWYLFKGPVKPSLQILYEILQKICGAETTGAVIYYNKDVKETPLKIMKDAFEFISKASSLSIRLIYQVEKEDGSFSVQTEDFFA